MGDQDVSAVEEFIARWQDREGGQERANYVSFLTELIALLGLPKPDPADATHEHNDYVFERVVKKSSTDGASYGRIDLYKKSCFVLEAKQSRLKGLKKVAGQSELFASAAEGSRGRRGADRAWDVLMLNAKRQAEEYARALPASHGWPPFILVCDVGHCIEVYADFTGQGKNYTQFPDRQSFRIYLEDLRNDDVRERLQKIWLDPQALDPAQASAKVTRDIARRLAHVSLALEKQGFVADDVAMFLMRCLFTMFAEDVELLPENAFKNLLEECENNPEAFVHDVGQLWEAMDLGQWAHALKTKVKRFNGEFFKNRAALPLGREEIGELREAAGYDWKEVDPSIFGTLLEQALDPTERKRLGAHYTPRAYVERLVIATIIEPLREDWRNVQATAETLRAAGDLKGAADAVQKFHDQLCQTRVLDPACGTGNFLYVSLELMKRLEGEVLEALLDLGGQEALRGLGSHSIDPHQFLGMEINPRAAAIAELVLWIGYLQWHFRTKGGAPDEPILKAFKNIQVKNAVLTWDGAPLPKIEGGKETYPNPRRPEWPAAEFIVGNPPFIGGKDVRSRIPYAEELWAAHKHMNESADFVMYWWDRAAELLTRKGTVLRRFGLVTTNSISQVFQRRVMEKYLKAKKPISLIMAIPDHPWTKATPDAAAVRIAMTVAVTGKHDGLLQETVAEAKLDTDTPEIEFEGRLGLINSDLTIGVDVTAAGELGANEGVCSPGVKLHGSGFIISREEAVHLGLERREGLNAHIRDYRNGRDLTSRSRNVMVIDLFGLEAEEVKSRFPEVYQHLATTVKPERDANNRDSYRLNWWVFGEPRKDLRPALVDLRRYIATVETTKHRVFQFLDASILPDNMLVAIGSDDAFHLGVLSSRLHVTWTLAQGGTLEDRPRYTKSQCFDPFPFPDANNIQKQTIRVSAEELDAHRKRVLAEHPHLTLTGLYNVLERIKAGAVPQAQPSSPGSSRGSTSSVRARKKGVDGRDEPGHDGRRSSTVNDEQSNVLTPDEQRIFDDGLVLILKELHDRLDVAVAEAYGWPADLTDDEILARLVALNKERAAEEKRGLVRWLRPDYQIPRFAKGVDKQAVAEEGAQIAASLDLGEKQQKPSFPASAVEQTAAVFAALAAASGPIDAKGLAAQFKRTKTTEKKVADVLASLARLGYVSSPDGISFMLRKVA
ncbi:type II restriction/modification system DNA methylase subunit YeeA [Rhodopseudomonas faecalis]|uniref:site-specific DNA-methyltransferase (adenine-specific) n=1 Tax=Rhodopseudomonas faecalis TaxID=99655 RepID=A0A318TI98_9BRAD|nr:DNA methyltransferase [Rhodopseudomonas faecalis]PYF01535.1 type II restriction/modification system DNA methylase subunit YeeA [Rhodopseudomonas faecalis]